MTRRKATNTPRFKTGVDGQRALTRAEHDALVTKRGRPVTDLHMRPVSEIRDDAHANTSIIDKYLDGAA